MHGQRKLVYQYFFICFLLQLRGGKEEKGTTKMGGLVLSLSSTFSRLSLFLKPPLPYTIRTLRTHLIQQKQQPTFCFVSPPFNSISTSTSTTSNFDSQKTQTRISAARDDLVVLGIETSCDDTAAAVVRSDGEILSQVVSSQVVQRALEEANLSEIDLSAVAVTIGPGLSLCLRVGVQKARKIAGRFNLPIVGVHHMEAHALVARVLEKELQFPFLTLLISGGHNLLVLARDLGQYEQLGTTKDDAIGEAYDKTARWLGLDMRRGGPALEELAREGNADSVKFSVPMKQHKDCNFSYAGLKTQVRRTIASKNIDPETPISSVNCKDRSTRADIAASFQRVAVLHLEERCERAIEKALKTEPSIKFLVVSGGVASNQYVRTRLDQVVKRKGMQLVCPPPSLCTDNGVMIAWTGIEHFRMGRFDPPPPADEPEDAVFDLRPRWPLGEEYAERRSGARSMRKARMHPSLTSIIQASMQEQQQHQ